MLFVPFYYHYLPLIYSYSLEGPSWLWSYGSWIYRYLCNQFLSPLMLWVRVSIRARSTTLCDKVCQWLPTGRWFSPWYKQSCICVRGIDVASFNDFSLGLGSCSYSVSVCGFFSFFILHFLLLFFLFEK